MSRSGSMIKAGATALTLFWGAIASAASLGLSADRAGGPAHSGSPIQTTSDPNSLRVCAAKKQPPLSLEDGSGFENKIAVALAEAMNCKAEFDLVRQAGDLSCARLSRQESL